MVGLGEFETHQVVDSFFGEEGVLDLDEPDAVGREGQQTDDEGREDILKVLLGDRVSQWPIS